MTKRTICSFAYALQTTPIEGAIFQRGQYYIKLTNPDSKNKRDAFKYGIFLGSSMLGAIGQLAKAKRILDTIYLEFPFYTDLDTITQKQRLDFQAYLRELKNTKGLKLRDDFRLRQIPSRLVKRVRRKNWFEKQDGDFTEELLNRLEFYQDKTVQANSITKLKKISNNVQTVLVETIVNAHRFPIATLDRLDDLKIRYLNLHNDPNQDQSKVYRTPQELVERKAALLLTAINAKINEKRRPSTKRKALKPSEVTELLRAGLTCSIDPNQIVRQLQAEPVQTQPIKEAIEILQATTCRKVG